MYINVFEINVSKYMNLTLLTFFQHLREEELELLRDVDMLILVEKGARGGICHALYATVNNKYLKDYDSNKVSSYLMYWDVKKLFGWAMSQKVPVDTFEWK